MPLAATIMKKQPPKKFALCGIEACNRQLPGSRRSESPVDVHDRQYARRKIKRTAAALSTARPAAAARSDRQAIATTGTFLQSAHYDSYRRREILPRRVSRTRAIAHRF